MACATGPSVGDAKIFSTPLTTEVSVRPGIGELVFKSDKALNMSLRAGVA